MYYTYILRCENDTLYTGITTDVKRRMDEHFGKKSVGAKYTKSHTAKRLEAVWESADRSLASKLEARIKQLKRVNKELLIRENDLSLMPEISPDDYKRADVSEFIPLTSE